MSRQATLGAAYRWSVASRVFAAILGGYALTSAATVLLALIWPLPKAQALLSATMLSFTIYTVIVIWVFTTRTATRAWVGLVVATAATSGLAALAYLIGGG